MKIVKMTASILLGIWIFGTTVMMLFYEIERKQECIDGEGLLKGLFFCETDAISNSDQTVRGLQYFIEGLKWPIHLFTDTKAKNNDITAATKWSRMGTTIDNENTFYIDDSTISKKGEFVKIFSLIEPNEDPIEYSTKFHTEYNCKKRESRTINSVLYSGEKGGGKAVDISHISQALGLSDSWQPIMPLTIESIVLDLVCHDWVKVDEDVRGGAYIDSLVRKNKQLRTFWILFSSNENALNAKSPLSIRVELEFDCDNKRNKVLRASSHTKQMAVGDIVYYLSTDDPKLKELETAGVNDVKFKESIKEFACKKT